MQDKEVFKRDKQEHLEQQTVEVQQPSTRSNMADRKRDFIHAWNRGS